MEVTPLELYFWSQFPFTSFPREKTSRNTMCPLCTPACFMPLISPNKWCLLKVTLYQKLVPRKLTFYGITSIWIGIIKIHLLKLGRGKATLCLYETPESSFELLKGRKKSLPQYSVSDKSFFFRPLSPRVILNIWFDCFIQVQQKEGLCIFSNHSMFCGLSLSSYTKRN